MMQVSAASRDDETLNTWNWSTEWTERYCVWIRWNFGLLSTHRSVVYTCSNTVQMYMLITVEQNWCSQFFLLVCLLLEISTQKNWELTNHN